MGRYDDIDPQDLDPATGAPYCNYSSPALDTSFHDGEMDVDDDDDEPDPDRQREDRIERERLARDEDEDFYSDDPRAMQGMGL